MGGSCSLTLIEYGEWLRLDRRRQMLEYGEVFMEGGCGKNMEEQLASHAGRRGVLLELAES